MPRRVPVPSLRPALELCQPTGVALAGGSRVLVAADEGGVAQALAGLLEKRGVSVLTLAPGAATADVTAQRVDLADRPGPIQGVFWLPALDVEPLLGELDLAAFREANRRRVKNLHAAMRALYESVAAAGTFLVSATRMGGLHGQTPEGATAPLGGAVAGFTKAYKRERGDVLVKVVDFAPACRGGRGRRGARGGDARAIRASSRSAATTSCAGRSRSTEQPAKDGRPGLALTKDTVFVVTGAAGGITSAIVADLAGASGGTFYLLDLVTAPARDDRHIALLRQDREALKKALIEEARARGEKPTPVVIDKQIMATERAEAALRAVESVEAVGGKALWRSVNLLDGPAVTAVVDEIRKTHGRIDVLVHAGGHRDQPQALREGGEGVRPRLRHQGRRLLQPAARGRGHAARRHGRVQLDRRPLRQRRTDGLQLGERAPVLDVARARAGTPEDAHDRDRLDGLGRDRHGDTWLDPADHGRGRHHHAAARVGDPDRAS